MSVGAELVPQCREVMRRGSLSFFFAARLLGREARDAITLLYAWCRYADDLIDQADSASREERQEIADQLRSRTLEAMQMPNATGTPLGYRAMGALAALYQMPPEYPLELTRGMQMDADGERYETLDDLRLYCYRVAGVVGIMFSQIIGVSDERALAHAADLGIAMQMTNIARDVLEDAGMGRIYLPLAWLREAGIPCDPARFGEFKGPLAAVTQRLLTVADGHYRSGEAGLRYLPLRASLAVAAARYIYGAIGILVRRRGAQAWDHRAVVPLSSKILWLLRGTLLVLRDLPSRLTHPWQRRTISHIWRYPSCEAPPT